MQELLTIILAIVLNLSPTDVTEFTVQITEGEDSVAMKFEKQEDGGWKPKGGEGIDESSRYYISGTKLTEKADGRTTTQDLAKHMTIGAMPFEVRHQTDGLAFLVKTEKKDARVVRVRWEAEEE